MKVWQGIQEDLRANKKVALLYVLQSEGSSPGRRGFKMKVNQAGEMEGSIGGGFMEHKLVELARSKLGKGTQPFIKHQVHRKNADRDQSGMICSGKQTVAFYFLSPSDHGTIESIVSCQRDASKGILVLSSQGISFNPIATNQFGRSSFTFDETSWDYREQLGATPRLYIIGGGHVGLALSQTMSKLGFQIIVFDDRQGLNTLEQNIYAYETCVIDYKEIAYKIKALPDTYVVIMTFGYRPDKVVLKQLVGKDFRYLGMLGSVAKVNQLMAELHEEGVDPKALDQVYAPIGVQIASQTPDEIAISIAAEIISIRNKARTGKV
ncbi:MAG: XdhC family protein [Cyclobacteriaceae bacterium]